MTVKNIGKRIKKALEEKDLNTTILSKKLKKSRQQIYNWIKEKNFPSLDNLDVIMELTGKDANYFFGYPSVTGNNHIVGDNNHNINQTVNNSADIEALKQDVALIKQIILNQGGK